MWIKLISIWRLRSRTRFETEAKCKMQLGNCLFTLQFREGRYTLITSPVEIFLEEKLIAFGFFSFIPAGVQRFEKFLILEGNPVSSAVCFHSQTQENLVPSSKVSSSHEWSNSGGWHQAGIELEHEVWVGVMFFWTRSVTRPKHFLKLGSVGLGDPSNTLTPTPTGN